MTPSLTVSLSYIGAPLELAFRRHVAEHLVEVVRGHCVDIDLRGRRYGGRLHRIQAVLNLGAKLLPLLIDLTDVAGRRADELVVVLDDGRDRIAGGNGPGVLLIAGGNGPGLLLPGGV